jgi:hypothetical protein
MRSRQEALLEQDLAGIQAFLSEFDPPSNGEEREVELNSTGEVVICRNFPLPDDGFDPDFIDLLVLVTDYPSRPPIGIYLLEQNNRRLIGQIQGKFHVLNTAAHDAPPIPGYKWICVHYEGNTWKFNPNHLAAGDNLRKYLIHFFNRLHSDGGLA